MSDKRLYKLNSGKLTILSASLALYLNTVRNLRESVTVHSIEDFNFIGSLIVDENLAEEMLVELQKKLIEK